MAYVKYDREKLSSAVAVNVSLAGVLRTLGKMVTGGSYGHLKKRITDFGISTAHFTGQGHAKDKPSNKRKAAAEVLIFDESRDRRQDTAKLTRAMLESGVEYRCVECDCDGTWNDAPLTLHVDHKSGDWRDNRKENLRFMCPNCHSQTDTFGFKNRDNALVTELVDVAVSNAAASA